MNKNLIWRIILAIIFISCLFSSTTLVLSQQIENDETDNTESESLGKPCSQSFHCWRTEPVSENGMPLSLTNRISKRIDLAGIARSKGARCRCRESVCQYFVSTQQRFLPCEEF
uniref:Uncharacterized protein n=1 Tax=Panagrolaimus sp. PS1159 TaxID=55785 RepID=A0AC35FK28_9BILA